MRDKIIDIRLEKVQNGFHITVTTESEIGQKSVVKFIAKDEAELEGFLSNYAKGLVLQK